MGRSNEVLLQRSEYDIASVKDLERELGALSPGDAAVDFSNVRYMDTTALRSLVQSCREVTANGERGTITLRNVGPSMRRILDVVGLGQIFKIE
jgi:anti-anti-sigma factor